MHVGKLVFAQLMDLVPWRRFETCVRRYQGDRGIQSFSCAEHWRVMAFAQLTYRESLRDIEACLGAVREKLYHLGLRGGVSRNNLSHANRQRDWRIYADFAQVLMSQARVLYADEDLGIDLEATVYALDASLIDVCLSLFPWARFRRHEGATFTTSYKSAGRAGSNPTSSIGSCRLRTPISPNNQSDPGGEVELTGIGVSYNSLTSARKR